VEHPKAIGDRTTLAVMLALSDAGYSVLVPFGENTRYDLVIDDGQVLARVQCKTGRLRCGSIRFKTCSTYSHHRNPVAANRSYAGQIEYFAVYCPETGGVYLIPLEEVSTAQVALLRVEPARNGQAKRVRRAVDYEVCNVALSGALRVSAGA
jgi:PD-(D/E)XK nuclease superfamily protein